jgi:hypothetical protein
MLRLCPLFLLALDVVLFARPLQAEEPFDYFRNSWQSETYVSLGLIRRNRVLLPND